jgi:hypothetical protein
MAINEAVNVKVDVQGTGTVKSAVNDFENLSDAVKKTAQEANKLASTYGLNDERTQTAIKTAANYKKAMNDLQKAIGNNANGVGNLTKATQGVVAGMQIAVGVTGLFGSENKELEKSLLQVQSAMSLSQGLKDFKEFLPAILSVATAVKTQLITAFSTLKGAIASTGIGLLIVSLGVLIQKIGEYNDEIDNTIDKELELARIRDKEGVESIERSVAATQRALEVKLLLAQKEGKSQQELRDIELKTLRDRRNSLREFYADQNKSQAERAKALEEYNKISDIVTRKEIDNQIAINNAKKEAAEQAKKIAKELQETEQKRLEDEFQAWQNQEIANQEYREKLAEEEFEAWQAQEIANQEYREKLEEEEFQAWQAQEIANYEYRTQLAEKEAEEEKARKQAVADLEQKLFDESQALANAVISLAGEQSKIGKAVALASIAADTAKALSGALSNANNPASPDNIATGGLAAIPKYIALATTILTNSKRAYDIIKAPAPSGATASGGGASLAAATSVPTFQAPSVRLGVQGEQFTQVNRVYVTEADISGTQNRVKVTEGISTI